MHAALMHHSALLVALGWVAHDTTFEPDPISIVGADHEQLAA